MATVRYRGGACFTKSIAGVALIVTDSSRRVGLLTRRDTLCGARFRGPGSADVDDGSGLLVDGGPPPAVLVWVAGGEGFPVPGACGVVVDPVTEQPGAGSGFGGNGGASDDDVEFLSAYLHSPDVFETGRGRQRPGLVGDDDRGGCRRRDGRSRGRRRGCSGCCRCSRGVGRAGRVRLVSALPSSSSPSSSDGFGGADVVVSAAVVCSVGEVTVVMGGSSVAASSSSSRSCRVLPKPANPLPALLSSKINWPGPVCRRSLAYSPTASRPRAGGIMTHPQRSLLCRKTRP